MADKTFEEIANEMTPEQRMLDRQIGGLRHQNARMLQQLAQLGAGTDLGVPRVEKMLEYFVEIGLITIDDRLAEQKRWEIALREQLSEALAQFRQMAHAQGVEQRSDAGLIIPGKGSKV